jgi:hypothetical protein
MTTFIEKLKKTSSGDYGFLRFPNGYAVEITRSPFHVIRNEKVYDVVFFQYTKPSGCNNDFKGVCATYTATYKGISVKREDLVRMLKSSEEDVNDFIKQVRALPAICKVPDTWNN